MSSEEASGGRDPVPDVSAPASVGIGVAPLVSPGDAMAKKLEALPKQVERSVSDEAQQPVGLPRLETGQSGINLSCISVGDVSVRSDWSDDFSPKKTPHAGIMPESSEIRGAIEEAGESCFSPSADLSKHLANRRQRHTKTISMGRNISFGIHSVQNTRPEMEDYHKCMLGLSGLDSSRSTGSLGSGEPTAVEASLGPFSFFGVFDGHGGARAAEFAGERLFQRLVEEKPRRKDAMLEALHKAFRLTEQDWLEAAGEKEWMDGTTAAVAIVDPAAGSCIIGNVGDSEVIVGTRDVSGKESHQVLTEVHHIKRNPEEQKRVEGVGGRVWRGRLGHPAISPEVLSLSVSRAIGDMFFKDLKYTNGKDSGLSAVPHVTSIEVCSESVQQQFLLVGCDGLWETVSYEKAQDFVFRQLDGGLHPEDICKGLVKLAIECGSSDNVTVILAVLPGKHVAPEGHEKDAEVVPAG
mmetsp:Transcript_93210/g.164906  ORF Transcript_93210/g.164906 Transcript_93210/m.164906 type:complete len:466 (-) Transcript_93210:115-1512(-)